MSSRPRDPAAESLHGRPMQPPKSNPDLLRFRGGEKAVPAEIGVGGQRLTKLLLNVTIERSPGPVHLVISPERTVAELIRAAVEAYVKEGRRPLLADADPKAFELHYSQYSLESLDPGKKLLDLGSRNFFLCSSAAQAAAAAKVAASGGGSMSPLL